MRSPIAICLASLVLTMNCQPASEKNNAAYDNTSPQIVGQMRKVMREGELGPVIDLDTISNSQHLYGIGPVEYLSGEILILDGKGYHSTVKDDIVVVTETMKMKAPFFGYARIEKWKEVKMPDTIVTLRQLELFLLKNSVKESRPFFFKVSATLDSAHIHVMALPKGAKVTSPQEAHALGRRNFQLADKKAELLGFFSTEHQSVFTHHDTFVHIHLLTDDLKNMGHLDALSIRKGTARLFLSQSQ